MTYDVFFHNDFDGVASAAVVLDFLKQKKDRAGLVHHLSYGMIGEYTRDDFFEKNSYFESSPNRRVVVDFPYHPGTYYWFDHHNDPFQKNSWKKGFQETPERSFDPARTSCASYVADSLKRRFGYKVSPRIKELCRWADIVDGAGYKSAKQTIEKRENALKIEALTKTFVSAGGRDPFAILARDLSQKTFAQIAADPRYAKKIALLQKETRDSLQYYRENIRLEGAVAFVDESRLTVPSLRYAPFFLFPDCVFAVRMYREADNKDMFHFSVGYNPWRKGEPPLHVGLYLKKKFAGGGHSRVGGCETEGEKKAQKILKTLIKDLNEKIA